MTIAKNIAAKASVAFVAAAMIFTAFAPAAQAQSAEELQKMINDLLAQVAALQAQTGQGGTSVASGVCPFTWTRDLGPGSTGADVMKLQQFLNADADTRVAASGVGSVGMETEFYGPATAAAVSKMQVKYRAEVLSPAGLVNPTGYFGPASRAKANAVCAMPTTPTTPTTPGDEDEDEDEMDGDLQGEGTLDTFEMNDANDTDIQEGATDEVIAEITMEAANGDIEVDRMTFTLVGGSEEEDPWEAFDEISLWVDGEMIASFDASDEDEYLDEDDGEFRFSGIGLILREDEEVEVLVGATVAGSVDGADASPSLEDWTLTATEVRFFDADGVADDDRTTDELPTASAEFTIVEAGEGEELRFSLGDNNPDATDIVVDTDDATNGVTILEYNIESEEGDIELDTLFVKITTGTTSNLVIDDVMIDIDGDTFDAENSASTTNTATTFEFDIDGDVTIDDGEEVTVKVMVDFRAQEVSNNVARYPNGTTIKAEVTSVERDLTDAEGSSDDPDYSGTAVGDTHTIVAEGIVIPVDGFSSETDTLGQDDDIGEFTLEFEVTAVEGDFYITDNATTSTSAVDGVVFSVTGGTPATLTQSLTSTADEDTTGVFTVREGETETFTLVVTLTTAAPASFRVQLDEVWYSEDTDGVTGAEDYLPTPASDFRTSPQSVN